MDKPRALISVWEKKGIIEFANSLSNMGWIIVSTGGTSRKLRESGIEVTDVSEITNHPEILDGRVKTLHPAVHGGILARRENDNDMKILNELEYGTIDLVCVNLYPFENVAAQKPPVSDDILIEMIDIGGPTMIRSAAKNNKDVIIATHQSQYDFIIQELIKSNGKPSGIDISMKKKLALEAFQSTAAYDIVVSNELENRFINPLTPRKIQITSEVGKELRYGENPHQPASFYPSNTIEPTGLAATLQHGG
ncbi:MAG: bifunctional phosphoribosylaminoimidazolecarboxamide formyltransferase/IMP cyclohydrolase, partial [Candidatus Poseidoniales archaeon]